VYNDESGEFVLTDTEPGGDLLSGSIVKLWERLHRLSQINNKQLATYLIILAKRVQYFQNCWIRFAEQVLMLAY